MTHWTLSSLTLCFCGYICPWRRSEASCLISTLSLCSIRLMSQPNCCCCLQRSSDVSACSCMQNWGGSTGRGKLTCHFLLCSSLGMEWQSISFKDFRKKCNDISKSFENIRPRAASIWLIFIVVRLPTLIFWPFCGGYTPWQLVYTAAYIRVLTFFE